MRHPNEEEIKRTLKKIKDNAKNTDKNADKHIDEVYSLLIELKRHVFIIDILEL